MGPLFNSYVIVNAHGTDVMIHPPGLKAKLLLVLLPIITKESPINNDTDYNEELTPGKRTYLKNIHELHLLDNQ